MTILGNKFAFANLTHLFWYDTSAGVYSANLLNAPPPYALLPPVPGVGDIIYCGCDTSLLNSGTIDNVVFEFAAGAAGLVIVWEQYISVGPAWVATGGFDHTVNFSNPGVQVVNCLTSASTISLAVNGITCFWLRGRVTTGAASPPIQVNRHPYSCTWGHTETAELQGDVGALAKTTGELLWRQAGAVTHPSYVWYGLRSIDRGADFQAYLNVGDRQLVPGTSITTLAGGYVDMLPYPTNRAHRTNANGDWFRLTISAPYAEQYTGKYHLFLRCHQTNFVAELVSVIARLYVGSTNSTDIWNSGYKLIYSPGTSIYGAQYFGEIEIPKPIKSQNVDAIHIKISTSGFTGGGGFAYASDIVLIPTDEQFICVNYGIPLVGYYMDIDSITAPNENMDLRVLTPGGNIYRNPSGFNRAGMIPVPQYSLQ